MRAPVNEQTNIGAYANFSFDWPPVAAYRDRYVKLLLSDSADFLTNLQTFDVIRADPFEVAVPRNKQFYWKYQFILTPHPVPGVTGFPVAQPFTPSWTFRTAGVLQNPVEEKDPDVGNGGIGPGGTGGGGSGTGGGGTPKKPPEITDGAAGPVKAGVDTTVLLVLAAIALLFVLGKKLF